MSLPFTGVFSAAATPLNADLSPDAARLADHAKALLDDGCHGVALLGTTGEANSFSVIERTGLLDAMLAAGIPADALMPGVGCAAMTDTIVLTRHALDNGVRTVLMLPPFYYKPVSEDGLFAAFAHILDTIDSPDLRVLLYHIPHISGVAIPHDVIARLIEAYPDTVVGIKDSSGDRDNLHQMIARFPGFSVIGGADPLMLEALPAGGAGCITAASNLVSRDLRTVFDGVGDPDKAEAVTNAQSRIVALRSLSVSYPQIPTIKAMLAHRYQDDAWLRTRPPLLPVSAEQRADIRARMTEILAD